MNDLSPFWNLLRQIRTDIRVVDSHILADWCERNAEFNDIHPISGLPLYFGARHVPTPQTSLEWLYVGPEGARLVWIRDRIDPMHHVWGRHRCIFQVPSARWEYNPFALPEPEIFRNQLEFLENIFLQDAEFGFIQAHGNPDLHLESATWGRLGPLWSVHACPDSFRNFFESHPDSILFHIPCEMVFHEKGPSICDDPLLQNPDVMVAQQVKLQDVRKRLEYRVVRERRLVFSGDAKSYQAFRKTFGFLNPEFVPIGAP